LIEESPFVTLNGRIASLPNPSRVYLEPVFSYVQVQHFSLIVFHRTDLPKIPAEIAAMWDIHLPHIKGWYKAYDLNARAVQQVMQTKKRRILSYHLAVANTMSGTVLATFDLINRQGLVRRNSLTWDSLAT
jgi:hypothetical protein